MANFYGATSLTGGSTGALDALDGTDLADGDSALVVTAAGFYVFILDADSGASEDSPSVIRPDTNAGDKRWIRVKPYRAIESLPVSGEHQVKNIRRSSTGTLVITYDGDAEA